jgi:N-acetylmuramoyl-L-alanine amidase
MTISNESIAPLVVIDPGHGGVDSGAVFENILEKDITLETSLHIKKFLEEKDIISALTRDSDIDLGGELTKGRHKRDLLARREIINKGKIAVSIHVNTIGDIEEEGAVVFYAKGSLEGEKLGTSILSELGKVQNLNYPKPIPRTNLFLLRTSTPPIVLVELGFLSNSQDRTKLLRSEFRRECAKAIADGVDNYLN